MTKYFIGYNCNYNFKGTTKKPCTDLKGFLVVR